MGFEKENPFIFQSRCLNLLVFFFDKHKLVGKVDYPQSLIEEKRIINVYTLLVHPSNWKWSTQSVMPCDNLVHNCIRICVASSMCSTIIERKYYSNDFSSLFNSYNMIHIGWQQQHFISIDQSLVLLCLIYMEAFLGRQTFFSGVEQSCLQRYFCALSLSIRLHFLLYSGSYIDNVTIISLSIDSLCAYRCELCFVLMILILVIRSCFSFLIKLYNGLLSSTVLLVQKKLWISRTKWFNDIDSHR